LTWTVELDDRARKELRKLAYPVQEKILRYLRTRIEGLENPRVFGQSLSGNKHGLWRYRVGDYRIICELEDHALIVLVVSVGHRKDVYEATLN
jgi:mRNA interferase RelE/StbE